MKTAIEGKKPDHVHIVLACACVHERREDQRAIEQVCLEDGSVDDIPHLLTRRSVWLKPDATYN